MELAHGGASIWSWQPHPEVWVVMVAVLASYFVSLRVQQRRSVAGEPPATMRQRVAFVMGVLVLWAAADWPLHDLSEGSSFSAHMVQHLMFALMAPPLLLYGMPKSMLRKLLAPRPVFRAARAITRPLPALILFNAVMIGMHIPMTIEAQVRSEVWHFSIHTIIVVSSLVMWWCVVAPLPEMPSLSPPAKMFYLFAQSILPTIPASFLTFARSPLYPVYEGAVHPFGMSTLTDQLVAGLIMKLGGGLLLWAAITTIFFRWYAREQRNEYGEIAWEDFERELDAWDLRR